MRSKSKICFSTQWSSDNIQIEVQRGFLHYFYIKLFFRKWLFLELKESKDKVVINFNEDSSNKKLKKRVFNYSRHNTNNVITTSINDISFTRSLVRSVYKFFNQKANVIGLSELFMLIIRTAIIEPIEYINYRNGWRLIHASVFKINDEIFIVSAGSKVGKSTLVSKLSEEINCDILSDNYCFVKDNMVRTIEEPMRGGEVSRYKLSFYGRTISGYPNKFEGKIDYFLLMKRGNKNQLKNLGLKDLNLRLNQINNLEKEGVFYLNESDSIAIQNNDLDFKGDYILKELEVAEGIENIDASINLIKNI